MSRKRKAIPFLPPESKLIPNIITVFALCAGLTSIRFALQQRWEEAVAAIFIALDARFPTNPNNPIIFIFKLIL